MRHGDQTTGARSGFDARGAAAGRGRASATGTRRAAAAAAAALVGAALAGLAGLGCAARAGTSAGPGTSARPGASAPSGAAAASGGTKRAAARPAADAAQPKRGAPAADLRCAPLVDDPAWVYAAGEAEAPTRAEAERLARERALGELARSFCASITTTSRTTEREVDGAYSVDAQDTIEVQSRLDGLAGVEERERAAAPRGDGVAACVVLRFSRLDLDARRREDAAQVAHAVRTAREASDRCDAASGRAIDEARARLVGVCPGTRAEGVAVPGARALLDEARRRADARRAAVARKWAVGVACTDARGAARPCPSGLAAAAQARLGAVGEAPSGVTLSEADAARVVAGGGAEVLGGLCASRAAVFAAQQTGQSKRALRSGGDEHFAVVEGRWVLLDGAAAPMGQPATQNAGGYAADEATAEAAKKAMAAAAWPGR